MRVLVIDDEVNLVRTIQLGWPDESDEIVAAYNVAQAQQIVFSNRLSDFDCIILDLQLPDASGSTLLAEIRKLTTIPVIMLSAWGDTQFRAELIGEGADDYVMKPVGVAELHARAKRLIERHSLQHAGALNQFIGAISFNAAMMELSVDQNRVALTGAETALLSALADAAGETVSRQVLYMKGFGREERYGEKSLETYVGRLRQKLTSLGGNGTEQILNVRGRGYRLVAGKTPDA